MFTHHGNDRTYAHNLKIASLLSFVAGFVNVVGYLSIQRLTSNVTGHFAFFVDDILQLKWFDGFIFFLYILFFFLGALVASTLIEFIHQRSKRTVYLIPVLLESSLLLAVALSGVFLYQTYPNAIALALLFAMGLQNSLVTKISNALVRTTHLTGLFTDLGIEVSQLFFYTATEQKKKLKGSIRLRLQIILFFFIGGIVGGLLYQKGSFYSLLLPVALLWAGLGYDQLKLRFSKITSNET
ncbi:YoaK family protein [Cytophagales bacterium LB-30]|uniref:YoaK family protein n=1 Tax=Shiella aurantiaca TaxID=3058365 RepID=A0ABT8F610_9BACT|nr:YoaK family protein [Shiella aurantiaca]MDN4165872.1 YoaK family protein [Shiella aurantiaca]